MLSPWWCTSAPGGKRREGSKAHPRLPPARGLGSPAHLRRCLPAIGHDLVRRQAYLQRMLGIVVLSLDGPTHHMGKFHDYGRRRWSFIYLALESCFQNKCLIILFSLLKALLWFQLLPKPAQSGLGSLGSSIWNFCQHFLPLAPRQAAGLY